MPDPGLPIADMEPDPDAEAATYVPPAVDREALAKIIRENAGPPYRGAVHMADAILSSGILRDAEEVRCEARAAYDQAHAGELHQRHVREKGRVQGRAELRAAIEALTARALESLEFDDIDAVRHRLQDIVELADDGAAALREHDARLVERIVQTVRQAAVWPDELSAAAWVEPIIRSTAGEVGG